MIVDSSAIIAVVLREPGWEAVARALAGAEHPAIGAPTLAETAIVLQAKGAPPTVLPVLMQRSAVRVISFTERHAAVAADAYRIYGRGHHPASLSFGDCMTYAVARLADAPLLFVGNDFRLTDLPAALTCV